MWYRLWRYEYERVILICLLIPLSAALLRMSMIDLSLSPFPGGAVGNALYFYLYQLFGSVGGALLLYALLAINFVMISRFSFMHLFSALLALVRYVVSKRYIFIYCYGIVCQVISLVVGKPLHAGAHFVATLLDGSAFEETELIAPSLASMSEESLMSGNVSGGSHNVWNNR